jgi:hypothetical protein
MENKPKRQKATFRINPKTIVHLKELAEKSNTSQGRIIDNLTAKEKKNVGQHDESHDG